MHRWIAALTVPLLLFSRLHAEDDVAKAVAGLVADLGDEDVARREAALTGLVRLGVRAEKAVRAELERAVDPEIQGRLMAALQAYAVVDEEAWALERIRKRGSFPASKPGCEKVVLKPQASVEQALESLREQCGVTIDLYAGDDELLRALELSPFPMSTTCSGPRGAETALWMLMSCANLTSVVDGQRVVIVRFTPAVLFERLSTERGRTVTDRLAQDLGEFESRPHDYWTSAQRHLRQSAEAGGRNRDRWFSLLRNRALDTSESVPNRRAALLGLSEFLGSIREPQPDVDEVYLAVARDPQAPPLVRAEAAGGLVMCLTPAAQDGILDLLAGGGAAIQSDLLAGLIDSRGFGITALRQIAADPVRMARLRNLVQALSESKSEEVSLRAIVFNSREGDEPSRARLLTIPEPTGRQSRLYLLSALHSAPDPKARERFVTFRTHADPEVRAAVARLVGNTSGGKDRASDVELALGLLADRAPIVRAFAANALGNAYSRRAGTRFDAGKDRARARLVEMQEGENEPRVSEAIRAALEDMGP